MKIDILDEAEADLIEGRDFYECKAPGIGAYFAMDGREYEFDLETGSIKLEKKVSLEKWAPVFERFGIAPPTGK